MIKQTANMNAFDDTISSLDELVDLQVSMLRSGRPLEAFDEFYDEAVQMFANDAVFGKERFCYVPGGAETKII